MNKKDRERITMLFQKEMEKKTTYAGFCALEKIATLPTNFEDMARLDEQMEDAFWQISDLSELLSSVLEE